MVEAIQIGGGEFRAPTWSGKSPGTESAEFIGKIEELEGGKI
jgi:hypothetical protein